MQQIICFQQSLFGKTSWERFHQLTGWTLRPCSSHSKTPSFQCLLLEDGQMPEWCEGDHLISHGDSWMPDIGQSPHWHDGSESSSWQILEDSVPQKYYLSPAQCSRFLFLAQKAGCPPPQEIEALLFKQGGAYLSSDPFRDSGCGELQSMETNDSLWEASDIQMTLFPRS